MYSFFDSGRCFYSMYGFLYRFRKMFFEAEIIDSIFYVSHRDYECKLNVNYVYVYVQMYIRWFGQN